MTWETVFQKAEVPTTVLAPLVPSTLTPVARLANRLLSSVGPAFSVTATPVPCVVASRKRSMTAAAVAVADSDSVTWVELSTDWMTVLAAIPVPETSMPTLSALVEEMVTACERVVVTDDRLMSVPP